MAANATVLLFIIIKEPDVSVYVSTYARENQYFRKRVASYLDGLEAARALRDARVIIGDVRSKLDLKYIAFGSMEAEPERVKRTRLYNEA